MKVLALSVWASLAASGAFARVISQGHVVHERRDASIPSRVIKRDRVDAGTMLPMRVGLKQNNLHKAEEWLMEVSHPLSEKYGQHWSQDEVIEAFRPAQETVDLVGGWLEASGIGKHRISHSDNKLWLAFDATAEEAESLLHTSYHEYEHPNGAASVGCEEYHIPEYLQEHIDYITPGVKKSALTGGKLKKRGFGAPGRYTAPKRVPAPYMPKNESQLSTCDEVITPACIQALYGFEAQSPEAAVSKNNSLGIFETFDTYAQEDLNLFYANFTPYIKNGTHPILKAIDGATAPIQLAYAGGESDLDFELAIPIVYPQTVTLYQTDDAYYAGGGDPQAYGIFNTFLDALDGSYCTYSAYGETGNDPNLDPKYPDPNGYKGKLMCGVYKPTNVISISYGEQEQDLPAYYQKRQCNEWLKLGLQGTSVFVASGDTGVAGIPGDGSDNGCLNNGTVFSPTMPNSCPWLTNVGATKVFPGKTVFEPESAVDDPAGHPYAGPFYSSGGFSNLFPIPKYQSDAIATYFEVKNPPYPYYYNGSYENSTGLYNRNGRGIPDVAANGDNIATYNAGVYGLSGGTSASAPIFASIVNRIVEERIKAGKGPVGFVNPVLYQNPQVLNDIVNGSNPGCGTNGFSCAKGWDPVTGLGTPSYPKMLDLFLSLP